MNRAVFRDCPQRPFRTLSRCSRIPFLKLNSGVDFFFVLSGFLLSIPFMESGKVNLRAYYIKRVFRILPVYYLSIGLCGSVLLFLNYATLQQILASIFFVQSFSASTFNTLKRGELDARNRRDILCHPAGIRNHLREE